MKHDLLARAGAALLAMAMGSTGVFAQSTVSGWVRNGGAGVGNAAVYLVPVDRTARHAPDGGAAIDQMHLSFLPSVLVVAPGTEVSFLNSDEVLHNVFGPGFGGVEPFDLGTYSRGDSRTHVFEDAGLHVVLCHIHPEMAAYVIVAPTPYRAVSGRDGSFSIDGVPAGRYVLHAWHSRHWRSESSFEITVTDEGRADVQVVLGRSATPVMEHP